MTMGMSGIWSCTTKAIRTFLVSSSVRFSCLWGSIFPSDLCWHICWWVNVVYHTSCGGNFYPRCIPRLLCRAMHIVNKTYILTGIQELRNRGSKDNKRQLLIWGEVQSLAVCGLSECLFFSHWTIAKSLLPVCLFHSVMGSCVPLQTGSL